MSNDSPERSAKRARTNSTSDNQDEASTVSTSAEKSQRFWFDDGNIVLRVETTMFRVHRGIVARHSPVFGDLFKVPQPPQEGEEMIEECLVVNLSGDTKEDWEVILNLIYDHETGYKDPDSFDLSVLKSMLYLGRKYQLDVIYKGAISRIRTLLPTTFEELTKQKSSPHPLIKAENDLFGLLAVVHELGIQKLVPVLCYYCVSEFTSERILAQHAGANPILPYDLISKLLAGRESLLYWINKNHLSWTTTKEFTGDDKCISILSNGSYQPNSCKNYRSNAAAHFISNMYSRNVRLALAPGDGDFVLLFKPTSGEAQNHMNTPIKPCTECAKEVMRLQNVHRKWTWDNLPAFFRLPKWDSMEPL